MSEELNNTTVVESNPADSDEARSLSVKALVWGILGANFSALGILGLIFSSIAKKCAKSYEALCGRLNAMARVGKILGIVGTIAGIIMTVFWSLYILILVAFILLAM